MLRFPLPARSEPASLAFASTGAGDSVLTSSLDRDTEIMAPEPRGPEPRGEVVRLATFASAYKF